MESRGREAVHATKTATDQAAWPWCGPRFCVADVVVVAIVAAAAVDGADADQSRIWI